MGKQKRVLLVSIIPASLTKDEAFYNLKELHDLVNAFHGKVIDYVLQNREVHDKGLYIGSGKLSEIAELVAVKKIDIVVLNAIVKPSHIFEMTNQLRKANTAIKVWDKAELILEIFSQHANTAEAKLQIKLAAMYHMGPRIYGMGEVMSRQGGGIGTLGVGETNTELMKRHWQKQIKNVKDKLLKLSIEREKQLQRRVKIGLQTVSLIGYTNAGKSSLFHHLTKKRAVINDALFVTLDSSIGKAKLPTSHKEILISDTIGFIKDLPHNLIEAFTSTLMESIHADLLLHVIDASDQDILRKIETVEEVLTNLGVQNKKRLYVFNKCELINNLERTHLKNLYMDFNPQFISAKEGIGVQHLLAAIEESLSTQNKHLLKKRKIIHIS